MYGAIIEFEVKKDQIENFKKQWESAVEIAKKGGLVSAFLLSNADTGKCRHVGFWQSAEGVKNWPNTQAYRDFVASVQGWLLGTPRREIYDAIGDIALIEAGKKAA